MERISTSATIIIQQILEFVFGIFLLFSIFWIGEGFFSDIAPERTFVAYMMLMPIGIFIWSINLRRLQNIAGVPASNVASAAQGYVQFVGTAKPFNDAVYTKYSRKACLWYDYTVKKSGGIDDSREDVFEGGSSSNKFIIEDSTGQCIIDPNDVMIKNIDVAFFSIDPEADKERYPDLKSGESYWCYESLLLEGDLIFALGNFRTIPEDILGSERYEELKANSFQDLQRNDENSGTGIHGIGRVTNVLFHTKKRPLFIEKLSPNETDIKKIKADVEFTIKALIWIGLFMFFVGLCVTAWEISSGILAGRGLLNIIVDAFLFSTE
jgi:hypothetical protein